VVRMFDLGSKGPGFCLRVVPKSGCMFVNIHHYYVVSYVILYVCCLIVVSVYTIVKLRH